MAKKITFKLVGLLLFLTFTVEGTAQSVGIFDNHGDIGEVNNTGTATYDPETQYYNISGSGTNMWFGEDQFHYLWKSIQGDFILRAHLAFMGQGVDPHRKAGWIVRNNLHSDSPHVNASVHGDGLTSLQYRKQNGGDTEEVTMEINAPDVIQLERRGNTYTMSAAKFGNPFSSVTFDMSLRNEVFVGLYVCSHNPEVTEKALFKNVRIITPETSDYTPYKDYIGSNLELLNVNTGDRKLIMRSAHSIQAPNWTPDGKTLIYNSNGFLYNYDVNSGKVTMLNTGFATGNNNDHVLNAAGTKIAISHHNQNDEGKSSIYYLPITGSDTPIKVTKDGVGHSYLHGWSPDESKMLFTGQRGGTFNIFEVSVDSGDEKQLTHEPTLDDGSEYSPDGKYIYFNSNRTGTMQPWRMTADGENETQLTFDELNDWFPHVSPDQQQLVYISFPKEVDSSDHPFYKHCLLRSIPIEGGTPKVIAYLYGGQGSINVPSWSPDGKYIAFVSNSN